MGQGAWSLKTIQSRKKSFIIRQELLNNGKEKETILVLLIEKKQEVQEKGTNILINQKITI